MLNNQISVKKLSVQQTHDLLSKNRDELFKYIADNLSYRQIAEKYNIHLTNLHNFLNLEENRDAKELALKIGSYNMIDKAESELLAIDDEATRATIARQTHLYQHRIYLAKVKNRKELDLNYKEQSDINNNQQIVVIPANFTKNIND
jgi:DNA invertase Pin-like site-specific DNA recombinase